MTGTHAVVVGGSMAGLCAGRVLSDFFDHVTIIDRDAYPDGASERPGVPQSRHVHALLARGRQELERLFPGFDRLMLERGAHEIDFGRDFATLRPQGWAPREPDGFLLLFASRHLLESVVRQLLRQRTNVTLVERTSVTGLTTIPNGRLRATGVQICPPDKGAATELPAHLTVDASGRASKAPEWLRALGLEPPGETVVDSFAGYSSRWFQAPPAARWPKEWWWKGIWIDIKEPKHLTAGVLFPVEQGRWIVTLGGVAKHYPPSDEAEFMAALAQLRSPIIAEAVRLAEPISPVYCNRAMANRFRHYECWHERLDGFIALGDSACAFNPVYGQGMTTGTLSAGILADCLKHYGPLHPELARHFFRAQAQVQKDAWLLATGADFRFPETEGKRSLSSRLFDPYMKALFAAAATDAVLRHRIGEVLHMLRPPAAFFSPPIVGRVALGTAYRLLTPRHPGDQPIPALPPTPKPSEEAKGGGREVHSFRT
ncbi:MAG: 2-polyprenyl-6-methoxyphenol hydroxylase-like oxidoreductase [Thermodesulfobacteriota bacterium]